QRQRQQREEAVAQFAHGGAIGKHLVAESGKLRRPLVMTETAQAPRYPGVVVGKLHSAIETLLEIRRRDLGAGVLAVEPLAANRLVACSGRRPLHVEREFFIERQVEKALGPGKLSID